MNKPTTAWAEKMRLKREQEAAAQNRPVQQVEVDPAEQTSQAGDLQSNPVKRDSVTPELVSSVASVFSNSVLPLKVRGIIHEHVPSSKADGKKLLFQLGRALKRGVAELDAASDSTLERIAVEWHQQSAKHVELALDTAVMYFVTRFRQYKDTLAPLIHALEAKALSIPEEAKGLRTDLLRTLAAVCAHLQAKAGADPFQLSVRVACDLLKLNRESGNDREKASEAMNYLAYKGFVVVVTKGTPGENGKASRYHYVGANILAEREVVR